LGLLPVKPFPVRRGRRKQIDIMLHNLETEELSITKF